ncbi:hypothetical protein KK083_19350 [Fulvivirgaceae bacterium PWU4]|uniref:Uncharacterized protein n=1 Tax=Chryseosolibacter histidini TaxID=2782349 RepID=A0AAP2DMG9_9BACT|nr:hypothetical protein [Chryseosolibacter histidini]MBT1699060.1 hypothetical protein [Chryseosolibacter histidini]
MNEKINLTFNVEDVNKILEALAQMPFAQVHRLIAQIHESASGQIRSASKDNSDQNLKRVGNG